MKDVDPQFERSIGVLTKVDAVQDGEQKRVTDALEGTNKNFILKNGWYALKNLSTKDNEVGKSVTDGRIAEKDYFENTEPYSKMDQKYFGYANLTSKLTELLFSLIKENLFQI